MELDLKVTELLCSRLCHDLVGPVGAINNGIELLEDFEPTMLNDILPLLTTSARQAWRRLDFFRVAFGFGGGRAGWPVADLRKYSVGLLEQGKVALNWPSDPAADMAELGGRRSKLLLNIVLLAAEALPRGGTLTVSITDNGRSFTALAEGRGAGLHARVQQTIEGGTSIDELDARTAQAFFAAAVARDLGAALRTERLPDRFTLSAALPA